MAEFGYHTIGGSFHNHGGSAVYADRHTYSPAEDGVLDSIFVHCRKASAGTIQARFALYDASDDSLVAETVEIDVIYDSATYHWYEAAVVGDVDVFAAKDYYFAFKQSDQNYVKCDTGTLDHWYDFEAYANDWVDPGNWTIESGKTNKYSVYATYTPSGVDETVYPDTFALALTQETPTIAWDSSVLPTTLELALTQETPAVGAFCTVTPDSLALALTLQTSSLVISSTALPDCLLLAVDLPPPTVLLPIQTILPSTFALALAQQTPIAGADYSTWLGISSSHIDSFCGEDAGQTLAEGLNGTDTWDHTVNETHWFILDLGEPYIISKVRGRSLGGRDPIDVNIYVSNDKGDFGSAVASGISSWQDTSSWVVIDTESKTGRYVKVEITATEDASHWLWFGNSATPFSIFDVYGMAVSQTVEPDTFALALAQQIPGIVISHTIEPATFQLALTQQTPAVWFGTICYPSTLALAAALQTPVVVFDFTAVPDPFSLALAQQTPVILTGDVCTVLIDSALELALAQEAPTILKNTLSWSAGLLTYKGITYEISAGVTQKKFVYWDPNYTTVFRATDVLQDIFDADGWVMCLNESGMAYPAFARKLIHGGIIQAGTITAAYGQIAALTVGSDELKDLAVSSGKIANSAVEEAKIAASAVSEGKLAALSVSSAKIQALAVTAAKIQDLAVTSAKIGDLQVTNAKIENLTVGTSKITEDATKKKRTSSTDGSISIGLDEVEVERIDDFNSDGNEIEIHFHCEVTHTDSIGYPRVVNLYCDTTKIRDSNVFISYGGGVVDLMWYYTPDTADHDYVVKIDGYYFDDAAKYRRIAITQDKGK